jgi:hypothetical protein
MVTVEVAVPVIPQASLAENVTVVVPSWNSAGASWVTLSGPSSLSMALAEASQLATVGSSTDTEVVPARTETLSGAGPATIGISLGVSLTVTVDSAVPVAPRLSVALKVTSVLPIVKLTGAVFSTGSAPSSASKALARFNQSASWLSVSGTELVHSGAVTARGSGALTSGTLLPAISMITLPNLCYRTGRSR